MKADAQVLELRILVLAPLGKDAELAQGVLSRAGMACVCCKDLAETCAEVERGAGAVVVTEEALDPIAANPLEHWLEHQPTWSDLPLVVLARLGANSDAVMQAMDHLRNVTVLERPVRVTALVSTLRAALRARQRQYETREHLFQIERLLESERHARSAAETAARLKDDFLATVSHELRTPLTGVFGWAQLLKRSGLEPALLLEGINAIERSARMQARLIDDLIDVNRIVSGKLQLDLQKTDLVQAVEAAIEIIRPTAEAKNITLQKVLRPGAGYVDADPSRLQQAVCNLLSNAVKFTPDDGLIQVRLEQVGDHLQIRIADSGIGINPQFLPHVFERFTQADSSITRAFGGLGLGLAIVKHIVDRHGGTVSAKSDGEGKGTTFCIRLPISTGRPSRESDLVPRPLRFEAKLPGTRILVVDDDPDACEFIQRWLTDRGAEIVTAASGQEALNKIAGAVPDLLVCDIGMPGMDGLEVIKKVRANHVTIPAIAVTAFTRPEDRARAVQAGFDVHVSKPIDAYEFLKLVHSLLNLPTAEPPRV